MFARENAKPTSALAAPQRGQHLAPAPAGLDPRPAHTRQAAPDALGGALARVIAGRSRISEDDYVPPKGTVSSSVLNTPRRVGGQAVDTVRTWITDVEGTITSRDDFVGRSHSRYGVGEIIDLDFQGPNNAAYYGGLRWEIDSGGGTIVSTPNGTATYTCPLKPAVVNLKLQVVAGNAQGNHADDIVATETIQVVGIEDAKMQRDTTQGIWHDQGHASVGFKGHIFFRPKDVSFQWARMKEGTCAAKATGFLKSKHGEVHAPTPNWVAIGPGDAAAGSRLIGVDTVATGSYAPLQDNAGNDYFKHGTFSWPIPWYYEGPGGSERKIKTVTHYEHVHANGAASIKKAGSGTFKKQLNDPNSAY